MASLSDDIWLYVFKLLAPALENDESFDFNERNWGSTVPLGARIADLLALCQVSRGFCQFAQPLLFRAVPSTPLVLRTLAARPDLAASVRVVNLDPPYSARLDDNLADLFRQALPGFGRDSSPAPPSPLDACIKVGLATVSSPAEVDPFWEAFFGLFLLTVPNLEVLEMRATMEMDGIRAVWRAVQDQQALAAGLGSAVAPNPPPPLSRVRDLRIAHWDTEYTSDICTFEELMAMPAVRTLRGWAISWTLDDGEAPGQKPPLGLESIHLGCSLVDSQGFGDILMRCAGLRKLKIEWGDACVGSVNESGESMDLDAVGDALRTYGGRLEEIYLDPLEEFDYGEDGWDGRIGSLRELTSLRLLVIAQNLLTGNEGGHDDDEGDNEGDLSARLALSSLLPESLELLELLSCQDEIETLDLDLVALLESGQLPSLRMVKMQRMEPFTGEVAHVGWTVLDLEKEVILARREKQ